MGSTEQTCPLHCLQVVVAWRLLLILVLDLLILSSPSTICVPLFANPFNWAFFSTFIIMQVVCLLFLTTMFVNDDSFVNLDLSIHMMVISEDNGIWSIFTPFLFHVFAFVCHFHDSSFLKNACIWILCISLFSTSSCVSLSVSI